MEETRIAAHEEPPRREEEDDAPEDLIDEECPGPDCPFCNGEACALCGPYLAEDVLLERRPPCEHDVLDRHGG